MRLFPARQLIALLDPFLPRACAGCDGTVAGTAGFCSLCLPVVQRIATPCCRRCKLPMEAFPTSTRGRSGPTLCSSCITSPPAFQEVFACFEYHGAVADALRRIKYGGDLPALRALCRQARPWAETIVAALPGQPPLLPLPSHPRELRRRGFHLPTLAASLLGLPQTYPPTRSPLQKIRPTAPQASLTFEARRSNVEDAFAWDAPPVEGGSVLLLDDVMTTGATVDAAAQALLDAGFDDVFVLVIARARRNF